MHVIVLGAGVVGVTNAFLLAQSGHTVTVVDKRERVAAQSSFANGGQLSYDFASPMGTPSLLPKIPLILSGGDIAFRINNCFDRGFMPWAFRFMHQCLPSNARKNGRELTKIAQYSGEVLKQIMQGIKFDFSYRKSGKLVIYSKEADFNRAKASISKNGHSNSGFLAIETAKCLEIEPSLQQYKGQIAGGVYASLDDVGDAALFTNELARVCESDLGVSFALGQDIEEIICDDGVVTGIKIRDGNTLNADAYVCCLGADEDGLLDRIDIKTLIYPVKGYSLTLPLGGDVPNVAITDASKKLVYSKIGDQMRIAGFADFGGQNAQMDEQRIKTLRDVARQSMPGFADYEQPAQEWVGLRPSTPDSLPIVGPTKYKNLFLNMGHGMFGWTLAAGSARTIVDHLEAPPRSVSVKIEDAA